MIKINEKLKKIVKKIKEKKYIIFDIIAIFLIALFCYSVAPKQLQNDTFYTVSIGNLIMDNGIDMKDHYSWHENLPYTYPHWLYDVIMSIIYNFGEWKGIYISVCICSIILGISIYEVNKKLNKNQFISFIIAFASIYLLKAYIAARAQLITFIMFIWIIYMIEKILEKPKIRYGIGIILSSILIANLHVAVWPFIFILFLPYIAEYIIAWYVDVLVYSKLRILIEKIKLKIFRKNEEKKEKIKQKLENIKQINIKKMEYEKNEKPYKIILNKNNNIKWLFLVMLICAFTGLMTPLGDTPYTYLYKTMKGNTTQNINEHLPLTLSDNIPIMCTITIVITILTFTKAKIKLSDLFMISGLTFLMFESRRQSTMFILIGGIILNRLSVDVLNIYFKDGLELFNKKIINIVTIMVCLIVVCYKSADFIEEKSNDVYVSKSSYPVNAADWILENLNVNEIKLFNEYNYGSYLLYRGIPVFIDSRADLYAPEFNGSKDIFIDFIDTSNIGKYYGSTFEKYGITHVIIYKNSKINMLIEKADSENYEKLYSDNNFVIYKIVK